MEGIERELILRLVLKRVEELIPVPMVGRARGQTLETDHFASLLWSSTKKVMLQVLLCKGRLHTCINTVCGKYRLASVLLAYT